MRIKTVIKRTFQYVSGCELLKRTYWYKSLFVGADHETYPDNVWYRKHEGRNFDLVNLGSSSGKWAFDYTDESIKAMNWAQQPQTLLEDYNLLRNFHSILRTGGIVLITVMPFTSLNKSTGLLDAIKYVKIGAHEPIEPYLYKKASRYATYPILFKTKAIKALIKYMLHLEKMPLGQINSRGENNPMNDFQLEEDAKGWIEGWKRQFSIENFDLPLTLNNKKGREYRIALMRELIDFCVERDYHPVYVIPPVTKHLSQYYTKQFEKTYIYSFLREVQRDIILLDYSKTRSLQSDDLYFNSFFLNSRGRKLFTHQVIEDLKRLGVLG